MKLKKIYDEGVLKSTRKGLDLRVNVPYLKSRAREGSLDQEEVHLAIIEGRRAHEMALLKRKFDYTRYLLEGARRGNDLDSYWIPRLMECVREGSLDQEDAHLVIYEGRKNRLRRESS